MKRIISVVSICIILSSCAKLQTVEFNTNRDIVISEMDIFPEGVAYDKKSKRIFIGSFRKGFIYEVDKNGDISLFAKDKRLYSVLGVSVDNKRNRLLAVTGDLGVSEKSYHGGKLKIAALAIFDLSSGKLKKYIKLSNDSKDQKYLANGLTIDNEGNAYITDSFASRIYKVDINGKASIFLKSTKFSGAGINLNGITYHEDGYLLTVKKSDGKIFKIPVANPKLFTEVKISTRFKAGDGVMLSDKNNLIIISNRIKGANANKVYSVRTEDNWISAQTIETFDLGDVYPTTGIIKDNKIFVMHSSLNQLVQSLPEERSRLRKRSILQQVGTVKESF